MHSRLPCINGSGSAECREHYEIQRLGRNIRYIDCPGREGIQIRGLVTSGADCRVRSEACRQPCVASASMY